MEKTEKVWETPYLVVLSRGRPDESVLLYCKRIGYDLGEEIDAQAIGQTGCDKPAPINCSACQARSGS